MQTRSLVILILTALARAAPSAAAEDAMRLHFIDVGQGAATLVEFPCAAILVDTGGERSPPQGTPVVYDSTPALLKYLTAFFAGRPDLAGRLAQIIVTHPHPDHTRGLAEVFKRFHPANVVYNGQYGFGQTEIMERVQQGEARGWFVLQRRTTRKLGLTNEVIDPVTCSSTHTTNPRIRALWGQLTDATGWDASAFRNMNNHSVVTRVDYGEASVLFTGDLEEKDREKPGAKAAGIERLLDQFKDSPILDVDVYQVGHHGSHNGTTRALVRAMSPEIAVIAAGPPCKRGEFSAWDHGHPRKETLEELESGVTRTNARTVSVFEAEEVKPVSMAIKKAIYSTSWDGTIVLSGRSNGDWRVVSTSGPHACVKAE